VTDENSIAATLLRAAIDGDLGALARLRGQSELALNDAAKSLEPPLVVTARATAEVVSRLLAGDLLPEQAQEWAALARWGLIRSDEGQRVLEVAIEYEEAREDAIACAVERLDGLGDLIDGTLDISAGSHLLRDLGY